MGGLTEDMTRLHGEISALHMAREALVDGLARGAKDLRNNVFRMRGGFRGARAEMAKRGEADRSAVVKNIEHSASELRRATSEMQSSFRDVQGEMARRAESNRLAFTKGLRKSVKDLKKSVSGMHDLFRDAHAEMAGKTRADVSAFTKGVRLAVSDLKRTVAGLRQDFGVDIAGAHGAWFGVTSTGRRPAEVAERPGRSDAARSAKEEVVSEVKEDRGMRPAARAGKGKKRRQSP